MIKKQRISLVVTPGLAEEGRRKIKESPGKSTTGSKQKNNPPIKPKPEEGIKKIRRESYPMCFQTVKNNAQQTLLNIINLIKNSLALQSRRPPKEYFSSDSFVLLR